MKQSIFSTNIKHATWFLAFSAFFGFTITTSAAPVEDFETIGSSLSSGGGVTDFDVGTAHFTGGVSGIAGIGELYHSGSHAWMVNGGQTGTIQFSAEITEVTFYAKALSDADGTSVLTAFDGANNIIETITLNPPDPFKEITITGSIDRIEFVNNDSVASRMNSLDDFSATVVPVPAALGLFSTGLLAIVGFLRKRKSV